MMHEQHWEKLTKEDPNQIARRANCKYLSNGGAFSISLLNNEYRVDTAERTIWSTGNETDRRPAGFIEQLCILTYLCTAQAEPLARKLVKVEHLDPGGFFFRGSHQLPIKDLENTFGANPDLLHEVGRLFDAKPQTFGDASIEVLVLPRIPMTFIIWRADEEFPARGSILFDQSASDQMPLDGLYAVTSFAAKRILNAASERD